MEVQGKQINEVIMPNLPLLSSAYGNRPNMVSVQPGNIYGYQIRKPFPSEDQFFKKRTEVAGMAAEDGKIVLNPYSPLSDQQKSAVAKNEAIRLWMRDNKPDLPFDVTPDQARAFQGTEYAGNPQALKETIVARILTGDASAMANKQQEAVANQIFSKIESRNKKPTLSDSIMSAVGIKKK